MVNHLIIVLNVLTVVWALKNVQLVNSGLIGIIILVHFVMNKSKYQIGDRLDGCDFMVRGVGIKSTGEHLYFLQIDDNFIVAEEEDLLHLAAMQATAASDSCYTPPCSICGLEFCQCG